MSARIEAFGSLLRLAAAGSRSDRVRVGLVALGAAVGTVFSLAAFVVLTIQGHDERYTNNLLQEPGLRPGVAFGCWLLLIPVLVFIGMCTRVCAERRERRYATFRLAGATPSQVRLIAAAETGLATLLGAVVGLGGFLAVRAVLAARVGDEDRLTLPVGEPFPWGPALFFCLLMPVVAGVAGALALRGVVVGPLGVARRHRRPRPAGWPALLLLGGPIAVVIGDRLADGAIGGSGRVLLVLGVAATCVGLLLASAWLAAVGGRLVARVTGRPALLIAARRLEADPGGQSWAISSVVVCAFFASATAVFKADTLATQPDDQFYARSFELVNLGILVAVIVAAAGLLVGIAESILERRRSLAALVATGTPIGTLRRAVLLQGLLPLVPAMLLATALGAGCVFALLGSTGDDGTTRTPLPLADLTLVVAVGIAASLAATALSLPFLHRGVRPSELRFE